MMIYMKIKHVLLEWTEPQLFQLGVASRYLALKSVEMEQGSLRKLLTSHNHDSPFPSSKSWTLQMSL